MTPENTDEPTPAEWKVLKVLQERGPSASRDLLDALEPEGWSASTVKTLLRRLVDKGYLRTRRVGSSFLYSTRRSPMGALRKAGDALLDRAAEGTVGSLLAHLVKQGRLTDEELDELRSVIDAKREERP